MKESIFHKVIEALKQAEKHNSSIMVRPEVILWPDSERQWEEVIPLLQNTLPQLLVYGAYDPSRRQGPAIWLKCMVAKTLPEANWPNESIPIIYLPGISKTDLRNVETAVFDLQPLLEYQYTGTMFLQENGREWSIVAFFENTQYGLGIKVAKDQATKEALKKALPTIFQDEEVLAGKDFVDADFLNNILFPDIGPTILKWMCKGDAFLSRLPRDKQEVFGNICRAQYDFDPDPKNIYAIAEKLGSQKGNWKYVWNIYTLAPRKYQGIEDYLRKAKPEGPNEGIFAVPEESWPQVNEEYEGKLYQELEQAASLERDPSLKKLEELDKIHGKRRNWIWAELGQAPLAMTLQHLILMARATMESFPSGSLNDLKEYYLQKGYQIDQQMRYALSVLKSEKDKTLIKKIIQLFYQPWLENITKKFQDQVSRDPGLFTSQKAEEEKESFILFVDAFRYELAKEFVEKNDDYKIEIDTMWTAIPSVTSTAKPQVSPAAGSVSEESAFREFRPQLKNGQDLTFNTLMEAIKDKGYKIVKKPEDIDKGGKYWQEIGDIDTKGHEEQSNLVKRVDELFDHIRETIDTAFEKGITRIRIVTDHGWLLLPGGLPKTQLHAGLVETRWGRCALIKEEAKTELLQLPWRWNPSVFIAYAPGITFFKANQEYAHGGISLHECLVPVLTIENLGTPELHAEIVRVKWTNLNCKIFTTKGLEGYSVDIRTRYNDSNSSIVLSKSKEVKGDTVTLMVDDDAESQAVAIVLLDPDGRIIDRKTTTVGE